MNRFAGSEGMSHADTRERTLPAEATAKEGLDTGVSQGSRSLMMRQVVRGLDHVGPCQVV